MNTNDLKRKAATIAIAGTMASTMGAIEVSADEVAIAEETIVPDVSMEAEVNHDNEQKSEDGIAFEGVYQNYDEANRKRLEKEKKYKNDGYSNITSEITEFETGKTKVEVILEDEKTGLTEEETNIPKKYLKQEEENLNKRGDGKYTIEIAIEKDGQKTICKELIGKYYNSEKEANEAISKFIKENNIDDSYKITSEVKKELFTEIIKKDSKDLGINPTDEEIEKAKDEIKAIYHDCDITFTVVVTKTEMKAKSETGIIQTKTFVTEEEALDYINKLKADNPEVKYNLKVGTTTGKVLKETHIINNSNTYSTKEKALDYINTLKTNFGEVNVSAVMEEEKVMHQGTGMVTTATKIDKSKNTYSISSSSNYIVIKQGQKGKIAVWTENALTEKEQTEFKKSYKSYIENNNIDGSTSGEQEITFINGLKSFDLSAIGNGWGKSYNFSKDENNSIILNIPDKKVSHVLFGIANLSYEKIIYKIKGSYDEYEDKTMYNVDGTYEKQIQYKEETKRLDFEAIKSIEKYFGYIKAEKLVDLYKLKYKISREFKEIYYGLRVEGDYQKDHTSKTGDDDFIAIATGAAGLALAGVGIALKRKIRKK